MKETKGLSEAQVKYLYTPNHQNSKFSVDQVEMIIQSKNNRYVADILSTH